PIGCLTLLDSHELAVVIRPSANRQTATRPYVKLISDRSGRPIEGPEVDLAEKDADGRFKRSVVRLVDNTEYRFDTGRYFAYRTSLCSSTHTCLPLIDQLRVFHAAA